MTSPAIEPLPADPFAISPGSDRPQRPLAEPGSAAESDRVADDKVVIDFVHGALAAEKNARYTREEHWRRGRRLLNNEHDWSGKAEWQSQIAISQIPNTLNSAIAILKQGLTQTGDWFDMELRGNDPLDKAILADLKDLFKADLDERDEHQRDFLDNWLLGLKNALATAPLVMKFSAREVECIERELMLLESPPPEDPLERMIFEQQPRQNPVLRELERGASLRVRMQSIRRSKVRVEKELVDPFDYYRDHTGRGMYEMQLIRGDADELVQLKELPQAAGYRREALDRVLEKVTPSVTTEEMEKGERAEEPAQAVAHRNTWTGIEFWGNIPDRNGRIRYRRHVATLIESELVRLIPFPSDDSPFRQSSVEPIPFSEYGRGLVENIAGLAIAIIELGNAVIDAIQYEVLKAYEVDIGMAVRPQELTGGIRPGKVFQKDTTDRERDQRLIQPVETGTLGPGVGVVLQWMDRKYQEGSHVTELAQGLQPVRGFPTAREITARTTASNIVFRSIAQWMEKTSLEPCLYAAFERMWQFKLFGPGGSEWVASVLGPARAQQFYANVIRRLVAGQGRLRMNAEFKVTAISSIIARAAELERLTGLLGAMRGFPGLANRVDLGEIARRVIRAFGYESDRLVKSDEELRIIDQIERRVLEQAASAVGQQPRSNSGLSAASTGAVAPAGT